MLRALNDLTGGSWQAWAIHPTRTSIEDGKRARLELEAPHDVEVTAQLRDHLTSLLNEVVTSLNGEPDLTPPDTAWHATPVTRRHGARMVLTRISLWLLTAEAARAAERD
jgi:hypothetical protein